MKKTLIIYLFFSLVLRAQKHNIQLQLESMYICVQLGDSVKYPGIPSPEMYKRTYRSPIVGLDNRFDVWTDTERLSAVLAIRATTGSPESWLQNMFAGMIPAQGTIALDSSSFKYQFATHEKAAVHVGWTIGLAAMYPGIKKQIDSLYATGYKELIITGYSQGAVIAQLLHAQLHYAQVAGEIPSDWTIKKYTTACPRAGNIYFAYDYEAWEKQEESFTLVNPHDWVPQTPMSVEYLGDYNSLNPFSSAKKYFKKMKPGQKILVKFLYNQLRRPPEKASKRYRKYLGKLAGKFIGKRKPDLKYPDFYPSFHYVRAGRQIVLSDSPVYLQKYTNSGDDVWKHHRILSYLYLMEQQPVAP